MLRLGEVGGGQALWIGQDRAPQFGQARGPCAAATDLTMSMRCILKIMMGGVSSLLWEITVFDKVRKFKL